jgi:hypothetical protein
MSDIQEEDVACNVYFHIGQSKMLNVCPACHKKWGMIAKKMLLYKKIPLK